MPPKDYDVKKCTGCKVEKPLLEFSKDRSKKDGHRPKCKACLSVQSATYREDHSEQIRAASKAWYVENTQKSKSNGKAYYQANKEKILVIHASWRSANAEKFKALKLAYYKANHSAIRAQAVAYSVANKKKLIAKRANYYNTNKEKMLAVNAAWIKANPDARRLHRSNRRARKMAVGGVLSKGLTIKLFKLQQGKCPCCKRPLGKDFHMDHKIPIFLGGSNSDGNIQLLRKQCNLNKGAKHPVEFMQGRGFLL